MPEKTKIVVCGSTGSIGTNTLDVVRHLSDQIEIVGLSAHRQIGPLLRQADEFSPSWIVATDRKAAGDFLSKTGRATVEPELGARVAIQPCAPPFDQGIEQLEKHIGESDFDTLVTAIVGSAGLNATLIAVNRGKRIALANKETLVMAGKAVMEAARNNGAEIIPVDSEHSAIFQALRCGNRSSEVNRLILTASGGPFREYTAAQLANVTVADALQHPTWSMGKKISIDSATMMNKALEIIEARWLFGIPAEKISVTIHPQSVVHSMVEFVDGAVVSQSGPPDMRLPIQYALTYPRRVAGPAVKTDWNADHVNEFFAPDFDRFPALRLGLQVAADGGTSGAVLNAANEAAVTAFLEERIAFHDIVPACQKILNQHHFEPNPSLETLIQQDAWARKEIDSWIGASTS